MHATMKLLTICLVIVLIIQLVESNSYNFQVPAVYVFGDSTADVGNNNYLPGSDAKANFRPYGVDFPHSRPTGRFSNAYNGIDFLVRHMGFKRSPPPFLSLNNKTSHNILKGLIGASFASGGSGFLDTTGERITMTQQIQYFTVWKQRIESKLGSSKTDVLLSKSIFLISAGGNDVFAFILQNPTANATQVLQFYNLMASTFEAQLQTLYNLGARKFGLIDVAPVGCCPISRVQNKGACLEPANIIAKGVNEAIKTLMANLSTKLTGMKYSIGSSYAVISKIIANPAAYGYENEESACCGSGALNAVVMCAPNTTYCPNRDQYVFWDRIHPTQTTSKKAGNAIYTGSLEYATPINFQQLVEES